jgi:hypothetical protein
MHPPMRHRFVIAALGLGLALALVLSWRLWQELEAQRHEADVLRERVGQLREQGAGAQAMPGLHAQQRRALQRRGLESPEQDLLADLANRAELIPQAGVLGGQMRFLPEESQVLNGRWVWAAFEDGHIRGTMLLEFQVSPKGQISWELIRAALD